MCEEVQVYSVPHWKQPEKVDLAIWLARSIPKHFLLVFCFCFWGWLFFFNLKFLGYYEVLHLNQMDLNCLSRDVKPKIIEETSPHAP